MLILVTGRSVYDDKTKLGKEYRSCCPGFAAGTLYDRMAGFSGLCCAKTSKTIEISPSGDKTGNRDFGQINYYTRQGGYRVKLNPGTYYINGMLRLNSNTYLDAGSAVIYETQNGAKMVTQPDDRTSIDGAKMHGYSAVHDITVNGGTWFGSKKYRVGAMVKNGQKNGPNVMNFLHATNITIKNATICNSLNAHLIELCGVKNGVISGCTLGAYRTSKGKLKKDYYEGAAYRGAIQLDYCGSAANNPVAGAFDGTACRNIKITGNYFWHKTGVQAAPATRSVSLSKNTFRCNTPYTGIHYKTSKNKTVKY